jgi:ABC-2 type transport system ATP-binding protein
LDYLLSDTEVKSAIVTRELCKDFGELRALNGLNLDVRPGEIYGFLGPNGAGKTTTIRILTGTSNPTSGEALVAEIDILKSPTAAKRHIGVVSQHVNLDADLKVREVMHLHGILHGMGKKDRVARTAELLEFAQLDDRSESLAKTLSGGMKRKLTIIRALMHRPRILLLDEPTTGLDAASRRRMWDLVRSINRDGVTVLLTTHYIEEAQALCDRVGILHKGSLIDEDTPEALISKLGAYAVDYLVDEATTTRYFATRAEAAGFIPAEGEHVEKTVRQTTLEDLFLEKTGQLVDPQTSAKRTVL